MNSVVSPLAGSNPPVHIEHDIDYDFTPYGRRLASDFAEDFSEVLGVFGAPKLVLMSARANIRKFCSDVDETIVAGKTKKFCEFFMATLMGTACDVIPIFGALKRWIRPRCGRPNHDFVTGVTKRLLSINVSLAQTLFRCKGLIGYASDRALVFGLKKHKNKVITSIPDDSTVEEAFSAIEPFLDLMMKDMREDFETVFAKNPAKETGSTQGSRKVNGKNGYLTRSFHGFSATKTEDVVVGWPMYYSERLDGSLKLPVEQVSAYSIHKPNSRGRFPLTFGNIDSQVECEEPIHTVKAFIDAGGQIRTVYNLDYPNTECRWNGFINSLALAEIGEESRVVRVCAISEAGFKVRTVSKGSAAGATVATLWQQIAFKCMRKYPCFPSLGGQIDGSIITALLSEAVLAGSSDFTESTDLLNPSFTNRVLDRLTDGLPMKPVVMDDNADKELKYPVLPDDAREGDKVFEYLGFRYPLATHRCWQPVFDEDESIIGYREMYMEKDVLHIKFGDRKIAVRGECASAEKKCGQLMGQATSFPLLCLTNLACSLAALRRTGRYRWPGESRSPDKVWWREALGQVIINGDDRLANSSREIEDHFWAVAGPIGLKRSPGKSHESPNYASINSQDYIRAGKTWKRCPCIRVGLMFGVKKLATDQFRPSSVITALFESVPRQCEKEVIYSYLKRFGSKIAAECTVRGTSGDLVTRNLFLPVSLGGMGQFPPDSWVYHVTPDQRRIATHLLECAPMATFQYGPAPGSIVQEPTPTQPPWSQISAAHVDDPQAKEDETFLKRVNFRSIVSRRYVLDKKVLRHCDDYGNVGSRCKCGVVLVDCPESKIILNCMNICRACYDPWSPDFTSDDCTHKKKREVSVRRYCECHGWFHPPRYVHRFKDVPLADLMSACRPRVMSFPQRDTIAERSKLLLGQEKTVETWRKLPQNAYNRVGVSFEYSKILIGRMAASGAIPLPEVGLDV